VCESEDNRTQELMAHGFFLCSMQPPWQYVSVTRQACKEFSVSSPIQPPQGREDFDLAELF
jgi:hypothetical protein